MAQSSRQMTVLEPKAGMLKGISAGLAAGALWGLVFVAPRMAPALSSVELTAGRFASCGAVSLLAMLLTFRTKKLPTVQQAMAALGMSVLGFTGYYLLLVLAIQDAGTELPALIVGTIPIWMMFLGKPQGLKWASLLPAMALTAAGLVLMAQANLADLANPHNLQNTAKHVADHAANFWRGITYAVVAMLSWTVFGLMNSAWLKKHKEVSATDWANWLGVATGVCAVLMYFIVSLEEKVPESHVWQAQEAIICIATGIGSAWAATILWNIASQRLSASLCGQLIVSETIFALVFSFAWDGTWPSVLQITACAFFLVGILISIRAHT
jgi:drug/metabolite transporter (DMT)-like permease